jgi:hypothetical protein
MPRFRRGTTMDTVAPSGCKTWVDICFEHLCLQGLVDFVFLIRWCRVSREWMDALQRALRLMQQVSFPGGVTGEDALRALGLVAGGSVRFLRMRQCRNLIPSDIEEILHRLHATCLAVMEVDVTGCRDDVVLRALAVRTISMFGGSPLDVRAQLMGLAQGKAHCPLPAFLDALELLPPRLVFGQEFAPDDGEFLKLAAEASGNATSVAELALLLGLAFPGGNPGETRVFDCNKPDPHGDTALLLACKAGLLVLATMLMDAGANVSVANEQGDTALLLACKAGSLELATRLKDAGADVSVANTQGETPLLAALAAGNLELAKVLLRWGADVKAERRDGAGLIALAIHSKRPDSISFALRHGPERIASQSTFDARAWSQAYASLLNIKRWLLAGASPRMLALEIGALLMYPEADAGIVKRLDDMRALLHRHKELLQDTAKWPVPHVVEQLAAQDLGAIVHHDETDGSGKDMCRLIDCITPSSATGCRWSIQGDSAVHSVAVSPDMLKLARGEGDEAVVCCAVSGLELSRLVGHR